MVPLMGHNRVAEKIMIKMMKMIRVIRNYLMNKFIILIKEIRENVIKLINYSNICMRI
jgi:hypothetical protein